MQPPIIPFKPQSPFLSEHNSMHILIKLTSHPCKAQGQKSITTYHWEHHITVLQAVITVPKKRSRLHQTIQRKVVNSASHKIVFIIYFLLIINWDMTTWSIFWGTGAWNQVAHKEYFPWETKDTWRKQATIQAKWNSNVRKKFNIGVTA